MQARVAAIELKELPQQHRLVGWLVVLGIYVALVIYQLYRDSSRAPDLTSDL